MILNYLKERTSQLHTRIEQTVSIPDRLRSVAAYTHLLARLHGFYAPLEDRLCAVAGSSELGLDLAERRKACLLRRDLVAIGTTRASIDALPRCLDLPVVADPGDVLGCLYVVEGATLGGKIVSRLVGRTLGLAPDHGCSFFASYGERVGEMWAEFRRVLEEYSAVTPGAGDRIVAAAIETFSGLDRWVSGGDA